MSVISVTIIAIRAEVTLFFSLYLFCLYLVYVIVVFRESIKDMAFNKSLKNNNEDNNNENKDIPLTNILNRFGTQLQTAFWHKDHYNPVYSPPPIPDNEGGGDTSTSLSIEDGGIELKNHSNISTINEKKNDNNNISNPTGYKFLILEEEVDNDNDEDNQIEDVDEDGTLTINLSGGLISPQFNATIIEDYLGSANNVDSNSNNNNDNNLTDSLLETDEISGGIRRTGIVQNIVSTLYWQQHILRRRLHRSLLSSEWMTYPIYYKVLTVIEAPFTLAKDVTIPTVDSEMWSKPFAIMQPILAPLFFLFISGNFSKQIGNVSLVSTLIFFGSFGSLLVYLITHRHRPPKSKLFNSIWLLFAFFMCVCWIYALAKELVTCLADVGDVYNISPAYLGLTVLAWGNSVGDLFSNTSVAKQGLGEMAIAGCYGGPVFNLLIGLGLSISFACIKSYPTKFDVVFDLSSIVSLVFLFISLISTTIIVILRNYFVEKILGYYLITLYALYTITQIIIVSTA